MNDCVTKRLADERLAVQMKQQDLRRVIRDADTSRRQALAAKAGLLDAYSPLKVLSRGYSVVMKDGTVVTEAERLQNGDTVSVKMYKGSIHATVTDVNGEDA